MSTQKPTRAAVWELKHPQTSRGVPSQLYTDDDPVTTIKGLGYRDEAAAKLTLLLVEQPGARYKAYWTVRALSERARNHPAQTKGMRDAIEIFERWMEDSLGMDGICHRKFVDEERDQRRLLVASHANAHARSRCSSEGQFAQFAADDRADAVCRLRAAATHGANEFDLAATSFVAAFGGPGEHGYGWHACDAAATAGLARFRCTCSFRGTHTVTVTGGPRNRRPLGAAGLPDQFVVLYDGAAARARLVAQRPPGQLSVTDFFGPAPGQKRLNSAGPGEPPAGGAGDRRAEDGGGGLLGTVTRM